MVHVKSTRLKVCKCAEYCGGTLKTARVFTVGTMDVPDSNFLNPAGTRCLDICQYIWSEKETGQCDGCSIALNAKIYARSCVT